MVKYLCDSSINLRFKPGKRFEYCNSNFVLLAKIIEVASGQSYPSYLEEHLFQPAGMWNTFASNRTFFTREDGNCATSYVYEHGRPVPVALSRDRQMKRITALGAVQGDGSVVSTVHDLYLWHKALLNHTVLSKKSTEQLFTPPMLKNQQPSEYAYGWYVSKNAAYHGGSWPGYQTRFIRNLETGRVGIVCKNIQTYDWAWLPVFDATVR